MTVSLRVMSAGAGYAYLLQSVAAGDGDRQLGTPLTRYYSEHGTPPGRWLGAGVRALGNGDLVPGDVVTEEQLKSLLGQGRDPVTGVPLGRAYPVYAPPREEGRGRDGQGTGTRRRAVAGYDVTFSAPKSVSVLWAIADADTQAAIVHAHHAAIADVLALIEREVAATRTGVATGDGAVAQVDVAGVIATAFDHFDSRAHDPQLHTHVVISNKVKTVHDGAWRSLDGRPLHAAMVALSEHYHAVLADRLTRDLGVTWASREQGADRNPAWDITGIPNGLLEEFSSRSADIEHAKTRLIADYVATHGRRPSRETIIRLRAQATLATRPDKTVHSLADLTAQWRDRAAGVLGEDATAWAQRLLAATHAGARAVRAGEVAHGDVAELARIVVQVVGEKRSTWRRWNLHAEASRQSMGVRFATTADREAVIGMIVDAAEDASLRLTPPEPAVVPVEYRRRDGSSVFRPKHGAVFTSTALLDAEDRLLALARATTGPAVDTTVTEATLDRRGGHGAGWLGQDQRDAVIQVASSGRVVDVLVGPAGTGKTTTLTALRRVWETVHSGGSVVGLAPSAAAADVLAGELGIGCENTAKWIHEHTTGRWNFHAGQLVIVDEASLAGTFTLDSITSHAAEAGAKVLLVGDTAQLGAVDAGGAFGLLVRDRDDGAPELGSVRRFHHDWERHASLRLRAGDTGVIDTYIRHRRVVGGDAEEMLDAVYAAWRADVDAGKSSLMVADTRDIVTELNTRARNDRIAAGHVNPTSEVQLRDSTHASVGDVVVTRRNDRRLTPRNGRGWVKNGDRWTVTATHADGSITINRHGTPRGGRTVTLPADYVAEHVELGYATTVHRAQGATVDTAYVVVASSSMTREALYVAMTRGREANTAYVATDQPHLETHQHDPDLAVTARSVLRSVLANTGTETSAHEAITAEQERWTSIAQLAAEYETIAATAQHHRWAQLVKNSGLPAEHADAALNSPAFGPLTAAFRRAEAHHHNIDTLLPRLVNRRGFDDAHDIAAVLHRRLTNTLNHHRQAANRRPRPAPRLIAGLIPQADGAMSDEMRAALDERHRLIEQRARTLATSAIRDREPWTRAVGRPPTDQSQRRAWFGAVVTIAAYRDRCGITGTRPLGSLADTTANRADADYARAALDHARRLSTNNAAAWQAADRDAPGRPTIERSL